MGGGGGGPNYVESTIEVTEQNVRVRAGSESGGLAEKRDALFGVLAGGCVKNNVSKGQLVTVVVDNKKPGRSENGVQTAGRKEVVFTPDGKGGSEGEPGFATIVAVDATR